jgi:hypothetical protein
MRWTARARVEPCPMARLWSLPGRRGGHAAASTCYRAQADLSAEGKTASAYSPISVRPSVAQRCAEGTGSRAARGCVGGRTGGVGGGCSFHMALDAARNNQI